MHSELEELRKEVHELKLFFENAFSEFSKRIQNYEMITSQLLLTDYLANTTKEFLKALRCGDDDGSIRCKEDILKLTEPYINALEINDFGKALRELQNLIEITKLQLTRAEITNFCRGCLQEQLPFLVSQKALLEKLLRMMKSDISLQTKDVDVSLANMLSDLGNKLRLIILREIFHGNRRFSHFLSATRKPSGQITFHLNKLLKQGLIKRGNDKNYYLTEKGWKVLNALSFLSENSSSKKPIL